MKSRRINVEDIVSYIDTIQFKKKLFGVNVAEVYEAMQELDCAYQEAIQEYGEAFEEQLYKREQALEQSETKLRGIGKKAVSALEIRKRDQKKIEELERRVRQAKKDQGAYRNQTDLLAESISDTQKSKEQILAKAREEAALIIRRAEEESRSICGGYGKDIQLERECYLDSVKQLASVKQKAKDNLQLIQIDLHNLYDTLADVQREMALDRERALDNEIREEKNELEWEQDRLKRTQAV